MWYHWTCGLLLAWCCTSTVMAGDWPQILGPNRDGIARDEKFTGKTARSQWKARVGSGLAGVAVQGSTVIVFHREGNDELLTAYKAESGEFLWKRGFPTQFQPQIINDNGPRAVPAIHDGKVIAYGAQGGLYCVDLNTGRELWTRATHKDFKSPEGYFGAGSAPLAVGRLIFVNVGGPQNAGVVAFDLATGRTVWQATNELASYAAPILLPDKSLQDPKPKLLVITRLNFLGLDPGNGQELFRVPFGSRGPTVNGALPVMVGDQVLLTSSYGIGARLVNIESSPAEFVWEDDVLSSQYTTPIVQGTTIYGVDGRQDGGPIALKCFNAVTKAVHWTHTLPEYATLIAADDKLLIMQTDGVLHIAKLSHESYQEIATHQVLTGTTRALPALSNGKLFIRNENTLQAVELK